MKNAIEKVAQPYRDEGYEVISNPQEEKIPQFLQGFQVDLIALRGNEGVVIEIKPDRFSLSSDPSITRMAEVINAQTGWKLDLVVLEPETTIDKAAQKADEPSDAELAQILRSAEDLVDQGYVSHACVIAWGGLEAAMRRIQKGAELYGRSEPIELMRTLYGNGFLEKDQFNRLKEAYKIRSQVVHGLVPTKVDPDLVRYLTATARLLTYDTQDAISTS